MGTLTQTNGIKITKSAIKIIFLFETTILACPLLLIVARACGLSATTPVVVRRHANDVRNDCLLAGLLCLLAVLFLLHNGIHYGDDLSIVSVV